MKDIQSFYQEHLPVEIYSLFLSTEKKLIPSFPFEGIQGNCQLRINDVTQCVMLEFTMTDQPRRNFFLKIS